MSSILFVCSGNTCRSAMAAALFQAHVGEGWWVESAGLRAANGAKASPEAVQALSTQGIDLSRHRSKPVDDLPIDQFGLILVMTDEQRNDLVARYPQTMDRVFLLAEMAGKHEDVEDPYGDDLETYKKTADQIGGYLGQGFSRISQLAARKFPG